MLEEPDSRALGGIPYWIFAFFLWPALLSLMILPTGHDHQYGPWMEIGYHVLNFIVVMIFFLPFLIESFQTLRWNIKVVLITATYATVIIIALKLMAYLIAMRTPSESFYTAATGSLLTNESDIMYYSSALVAFQPLWGSLTLILLAPFTVSCLLYVCVFASVCGKRPVLAYILIVLLPLLIRLSVAFCLWPLEEELMIYILQVPIHLVACWAYQKTDTVWTPIIVHFFSNLFFAAFYHAMGSIYG